MFTHPVTRFTAAWTSAMLPASRSTWRS